MDDHRPTDTEGPPMDASAAESDDTGPLETDLPAATGLGDLGAPADDPAPGGADAPGASGIGAGFGGGGALGMPGGIGLPDEGPDRRPARCNAGAASAADPGMYLLPRPA